MFHSKNTPWETTQDDDQTLEKLGEKIRHHCLATLPDVDVPHPFQAPETEQPHFSPASLELLRSHVKNSLTRNQITAAAPSPSPAPFAWNEQEPSLLEIIRIAAASFIDSSAEEAQPPQLLLVPYNEEVRNKIELVQHLLSAAEEVGRHNYDQAITFLQLCHSLSSKTGNLAQRVVYHFAKALRERVEKKKRGSGMKRKTSSSSSSSSSSLSSLLMNAQEAITAPSPILGVIYAKIPFYQVRQLAAVQAIMESVGKSKRIHVIDLRIRNGTQWTALMQALASRRKGPPEILKITAILLTDVAAENLVCETGERLDKFAKSMSIRFAFRAVWVPSMFEINRTQFDLDPKDALVVFSENGLHDLILKPNELEAFMGFVRNIRPKVMVVTEREADFNSLNFADRFVEVLFHYAAYFDCVDTCLDPDDGNKLVLESMFLSDQVKCVLVKEDKEMTRTATIHVWRKFFGRFWMLEARLSPTAMETVKLLLGSFAGGSCCTVERDGRSLVVGWKGTPIYSLSAWKFPVLKPLKETNKRKPMDNTFGTEQLL